MADIVLSFVAEELLHRVASAAADGITRAWGFEKDLQRLRESTKTIQALLRDAEDKQAADERVKPWLLKLQDVLSDAEDVLDDFSYETLRRKIENHPMVKVRNFVSRNNPLLFRFNMAAKLKKINHSMLIVENQARNELELRSLLARNFRFISNKQPNRAADQDSFLDPSEPLEGRTDEVETIMNMLQERSSPVPTIIAIVGIGGLGKTTLAKLVVEEVKKKQLFDETMWLCVSDTSNTFDENKVLKGMLEYLDNSAGGMNSIDAILRSLQNKLEKKSFLLVLDDVWFEWEDSFKRRLKNICTTNGNFVIFTTRNKNFANEMSTSAHHVVEPKALKDDECWSIIREKVLRMGREPIPRELESIGIEIAKKCVGSPLVAKVLGGTLGSRRSEEEWLSIRDSKAWKPNGEDDEVLAVLRLSFDRLQPPLKPCFAYCSFFPKDYVYGKQQLIELWMAEGFLDPTSANEGSSMRSMEDVGDKYFHDLLAHSLFQDVEADKWGNIISYKLHDLLHDLAESVSSNRELRLPNGSSCILRASGCHHLSDDELVKDGARKIRSFVSKDDLSHMFCNFRSLRSLYISRTFGGELSAAIGRLRHLRYIDISGDYLIELPETITKLYNLQTLKMINCRIVSFPRKMMNLASLRHIYFDKKSASIYKVGCLIGLRTLPFFPVVSEEGFKIEELEGLNNLTGELIILDLENVRDGEEAKRANLKEKKLSVLVLEWSDPYMHPIAYNNKDCNFEDVLEGLLPPPSVKSLTIRNYGGMHFPNWMSMGINHSVSALKALVELRLSSCCNCEIMPCLGYLPRLKTLKIKGMDNLRCIGPQFYGENYRAVTLFPALKKFSMKDMKNLEEWATLEGGEQKSVVFPCLEKLDIKDCPRLRSIPLVHLSSLLWVSIMFCGALEYLSNEAQKLSSLISLRIEYCYSLPSLSSLQNLISLKYLNIVLCLELTSLSANLNVATSLREMYIDGCSILFDLSSIEFSRFVCLEKFKISGCPNVTSLPRGMKFCKSLQILDLTDCKGLICMDDDIISSLSQLKELRLGPFSEELKEYPGLNSTHHLSNPSLESLHIYGWRALKSIPHQLQHFTGLKDLKIFSFREVETFPDWLGHFSSLQSLRIEDCDQLENLPTTMKHLSNLTELKIFHCQFLEERYRARTGGDWSIISHIPHIYIL